MELYNITSFVSKNRDSIDNVTKKVKDVINALNIDFSGELSVGKIIKINGEINKAIKTNKQLIESLSKIPDNDKVGIITGVIIDIINSEEFKQILSNEQRKQIEDFCNDTETAETHEEHLKPGDVVRQRPGQPHQLEAKTEGTIFEVSTTHFDSDSYRVWKGDSQK